MYEYSLCCIVLIFIIISCLQQYSAHGAGLYKTHLPYSLVPGLSEDSPAKYIYVYRNPKDVAVSFYHHTQAVAGPIPWDEYVESFMVGGKYVHLGPIFDNHLEWWEHKGTCITQCIVFTQKSKVLFALLLRGALIHKQIVYNYLLFSVR